MFGKAGSGSQLQVRRIPSGKVHPSPSPNKLIPIASRIVEHRCLVTLTVPPSLPPRKAIQRGGAVNQLLRIRPVVLEHNRGGRQGRRHLRGEIGAATALLDGAVVIDVLGSHPAVVVVGSGAPIGGVAGANLRGDGIYGVGGVVEGLEKVIGSPLDEFLDVSQLSGSLVLSAVLDNAPTEHRHGEGLGEVEFDSVTGVVVTAYQILDRTRRTLRLLPIGHARVPSPRNVVMPRKLSRYAQHKKPNQLIS